MKRVGTGEKRIVGSQLRATYDQQEDNLLLGLAIDDLLSEAPEQVRQLDQLIRQQYQETEIAEMMGISRVKVWRLRQDLKKRLESLQGDWGLA